MNTELASFNTLTEQTSRYLTPFELEVFGNGHLEGDQTAAEIVSQDPSNPLLIFEANKFRKEHSRFAGTPFIFEPVSLIPLIKQGFKTQLEVSELDNTGHADTIILHIMKDDQEIELAHDFDLRLREDKAGHIIMEKLQEGIALHPKTLAE